ncbi:MAG: aldehyde dehydrogenase family protein [Enterobacterales bacterium]|nr:aldehyde dehydrogenase family protein [Enterobacterales bacterium]
MIIGNPLDKCTDIGAIVDPSQKKSIAAIVKRSVEEGATLWQPKSAVPKKGCFFPPTLLCDVETTNVAAIEEIFGPVLSVMTFRHQPEAVQLANNTKYGLAASVWSENINKALDVAPQIQAGVVWINTTNQFDAACGFGGYKESGMGREGGAEGMLEYLKLSDIKTSPFNDPNKPLKSQLIPGSNGLKSKLKRKDDAFKNLLAIDQTAKHYINGKQCRADNGNSLSIYSKEGEQVGRVADGNRKDIRNAVEAAHKANSWSKTSGHLKAQILYYLAENLNYRKAEICQRLMALSCNSEQQAAEEFDASIERLFTYAAWADKYDGKVHQPPIQGVALAMNEPVGVLAIICPDNAPLLSMISLLAPAIAMGNRAIIVPSETSPLIATDFYQVIETSDIPKGVINIVTGGKDSLAKVLSQHDQVDAIWYHGSDKGCEMVELASADNLKRTWTHSKQTSWLRQPNYQEMLRQSCEVKNIWIPYGD